VSVETLPTEEDKDSLVRPLELEGKTYKISNSSFDYSVFVTINNFNGRPFEIFINSKSPETYPAFTALTRVISAVFRETAELEFLAEELKQVFDPNGGYWKKGTFIPSIYAELGIVLGRHLNELEEK